MLSTEDSSFNAKELSTHIYGSWQKIVRGEFTRKRTDEFVFFFVRRTLTSEDSTCM